ncbi:hypothetical protein H9I45_09675 [Polaribacter haliotis]|uniref:Uncharacterized protein n=1 Tax=Polaribacter haliotis TaxID=1888915 RepID=A0A7L8AC77_9FLAO|nr:hypothetical protein [Polaribacter haliotis]QOD59628.1 hypothetical protein H9I45_09675 [Polaribacter haliotis]
MYYKILFVIGLLFEVVAQVLLAQGNEFVYAQKPIDFAHWFLLLGVVFMIPQVISFPKKIYSFIGKPLTIIGIVCIIGMCILDFIWWSYPTQELRNEFAKHISQFPSIWDVFLKIGPSSYIFNIGLLFLAFNYFKENKIGVTIIILATLLILFARFIPNRLIYGYLITVIGFSYIFYKTKQVNEYQVK